METKKVYIPACESHAGIFGTYVNLNWICPVCGKPRGEITQGRSYDGASVLFCDTWENPCGHLDKYDDIRKEAAANALNGYVPAETSIREPFYPTCKFCGETMLPTATFRSQEEANEYKTMHCGCSEARAYQDVRRREKERAENLKRIDDSTQEIAAYCLDKGISVPEDAKAILYSASVAVLDDIIDGAQIKFGRVTVRISKSSKGNIVFSSSYSESMKREV